MSGLASPVIAAVALVAGGWLALAVWLARRGWRRAARRRRCSTTMPSRSLLQAAPPCRWWSRPTGAVSGPDRLAGALGLGRPAPRWIGLFGDEAPFQTEERPARRATRGSARWRPVQPLAAPGRLGADLPGRRRPGAGGLRRALGLLWFLDVTEAEEQAGAVAERLERRSAALDALSGLIEAAPFPMWHRGPDLRLAMVNGAYVAAVEGEDSASVVRQGTELIDEADGRSPLGDAAAVLESQQPSRRTVPATVAGERRTMQVVEVPLGSGGVAGYAIDVEDQEQAHADLARFVRAQRDMLDRLSAGVVQFGRDRGLIFFNQPFARLFSLTADFLADRPEFDRVIDASARRAIARGARLPRLEGGASRLFTPASPRTRRIGCCPRQASAMSSPSPCPTAAC